MQPNPIEVLIERTRTGALTARVVQSTAAGETFGANLLVGRTLTDEGDARRIVRNELYRRLRRDIPIGWIQGAGV